MKTYQFATLILAAAALAPAVAYSQISTTTVGAEREPAQIAVAPRPCLPGPMEFASRTVAVGTAYASVVGSALTRSGETVRIDLNGNALPDIFALTSTRVSAMLDFNGEDFSPGSSVTLSDVRQVRAGELDGQSGTDFAVLDGQTIRIFGNNQTGSFRQLAFFTTGGIDVAGIALADFNNDGLLDIAWTGTSSFFGMIKNNGAGIFTSNPASVSFANLLGIEAVNANNDAHPDIALRAVPDGFFNFDSISIGRYTSVSGGGFTISQGLQLPSESLSSAMTMTTSNGDAYRDLAVHVDATRSVRIYFGAPSGFPAQGSGSYATGLLGAPSALLSGDFDSDGDLDLAAAHSETLSILRARGTGSYETARLFALPHARGEISSLDIDRDGDLDLIAPDISSGLVVVTNRVYSCEE